MEQLSVGQINYSPDYRSVPASQCIPNGVKVVAPKVAPDGTEYYIPVSDTEQFEMKRRIRKVLQEFLDELDELGNSDVMRRTVSPHSYKSNQRHFLLNAFEQKIADLFPKKKIGTEQTNIKL